MKNHFDRFSAVAIFGSVARGDDDLLSDRDLLVVSENGVPAQYLEELRTNGFSPAAYTWQSLESLATYRSLFLVHLKLESKIVKDHDGRLSDFLSHVEASQDYSANRAQSAALAALTAGVPDNTNLLLWAADVLAVALRNYLVASSAERGSFIFSHGELLAYADATFGLDFKTRQLLHRLRTWKALYRKKGIPMSDLLGLSQIHAVQRTLSSIMNVDVGGSVLDIHEFTHGLLHGPLPREPWYHSIRRYEGAYRAIDARYFEKDEIDVIEHQIAAPTCYTEDGLVLWESLRSSVARGYMKSIN